MRKSVEQQNTTLYEAETLLQQYKKCTKVNYESLKQAKTIEDLVNIKIKRLDKELINTDNNTYNFQYDPIHFR